ncbi:uncharacterized protein BX664DRAFT_312530 [Halteromyces radiatus]|uniref:uncharacterized protein n=1 Tax=Halteromyces radiatus TaxID=101107 RepID=UPI00221FC241|nr:uncharacterized protein BX664DRAFT_312530 [Halteromyces radiatus]KAI8097715.1 hypothetical protein BX664DRAFT_312530 [Halteromyces radiatus]
MIDHPPPSPTFSTTSKMSSMSWIVDKAPHELIPMLKNAYYSLKEKEKDLTLAAEIGKQLLTTNVQLEQNYQQLLQSVQQQQQQQEEEGELIDDDERPDLQYAPSMNARQVIIEVLEQKNTELNERLQQLTQEHAKMKTHSSKRTKELESEMMALKNDLEMATNKIQELELMNQEQKRRRNESNNDKKKHNEDVDKLLDDVRRLEAEQRAALEAKRNMESKLATALKDLHQLKQQLNTFEFTEEGYKSLQQTYDQQFQHISELNQSLEDHRAVFQKLRDRGINIHSSSSTSCPSIHHNEDDNMIRHSLLDELGSEWNKNQTYPVSTKQCTVDHPNGTTSLLSSLSSMASSASSSIPFFDKQSFLEMDPFETILTKATGLDNRLIDDALGMIYQLEQQIEQQQQLYIGHDIPASISAVGQYNGWNSHPFFNTTDDGHDKLNDDDDQLHQALVEYTFPSQDLYPNLVQSSMLITRYDPSATRPGMIRQWILKAFQRLWRWFRFAFVLSTAIMISLWSGPQDMQLLD